MRTLILITLTAASLSAAAQDASIRTPALGFVFDPDLQAIRAIRGIPGAALLDEAVNPGFRVLSAAIAPGGGFALATAADSSLRLLLLQSGNAQERTIEGAMPAPDRIAFSPSGRAAALYGNSGRLQTISGLPGNPVLRDWPLPCPAESVAALAISDDATLLAFSTQAADSGALWLVSADGSSSQLPLPPVTAAAFRANGHDLLAVAREGDLYQVADAGAAAQYRLFHQAVGGNTVALRFSPDGARAYAAESRGEISVVDLNNGSASRISCQCNAEGLEPLSSPNLFRLTSLSAMPLMLFDASQNVPALWFVPRGGLR